MSTKHTIREVIETSGMDIGSKYTIAGVVVITTEKGCSIMAVSLGLDTVVSTLDVPSLEEGMKPEALAPVLAIAGQDLLSALVQDAGLGGDPRTAIMEEDGKGGLQDTVLKGIFKAPGTMQ